MLMHFVSSLGSSRSSEKRLTTNSLDIVTYVIELIKSADEKHEVSINEMPDISQSFISETFNFSESILTRLTFTLLSIPP